MKLENISSADLALGGEARAVLEAIAEALLVVSPGGTVLAANKVARRLFGPDIVARDLESLHAGDPEALHRYLQRCSGAGTPLLGSLHLHGDQGTVNYELHGSRVALESGTAVLLRIGRQGEERFVALTRQIRELDREIRDRQHAEAVLEETVKQRELLLSELHHRVKNNMHMLQGLLQGAERDAETEEARRALRELSLRVSAINSVQQLLYNSSDLETIDSVALLDAVTGGVLALADPAIDSRAQIEPLEIPIETAVPLALVVNELLTNAVKYGRPESKRQRIEVGFRRVDGWVELTVADNGPGFVLGEGRKRASGTGLVKGLVRQLGGAFEVEAKEGAKCVVRFRLPEDRSPGTVH
jgi:two-component sensor histidine kinase